MLLISYRREASFNFHTSSSHFSVPCVSETSAESSVGTSLKLLVCQTLTLRETSHQVMHEQVTWTNQQRFMIYEIKCDILYTDKFCTKIVCGGASLPVGKTVNS